MKSPKPYTFWYLVERDMRRWNLPVSDSSSAVIMVKHFLFLFAYNPGFACAFWYRVNKSIAMHFPRMARALGVWRYYRFANDISYSAQIGPGLKINHMSDIVIGAHICIGDNFTVYNGVTLGSKYFNRTDEKPTIGNGVTIGTGAKVLGTIHIGDGAIIGALTFCDKSVPAGFVAAGNPMRMHPQDGIRSRASSA